MKKSTLLWIIAFIVTLLSAYYQRVTGPTYPLDKTATINGEEIKFRLERSHSTSSDYKIIIPVKNENIKGEVNWKRYNSNDKLINTEMSRIGNTLQATLPQQPPAGKIQYMVILSGTNYKFVSSPEPILIRFKGDVPAWILIPHIILIFSAMLFSTRTGLEVIFTKNIPNKLTYYTILIVFVGGLIFGPLTQLYAFGELWTGFPFGYDLTDNKTAIAFAGWLIALLAVLMKKRERVFIIFAAILMFIVFLIPHSMFGSELDYTKTDSVKTQNLNP